MTGFQLSGVRLMNMIETVSPAGLACCAFLRDMADMPADRLALAPEQRVSGQTPIVGRQMGSNPFNHINRS